MPTMLSKLTIMKERRKWLVRRAIIVVYLLILMSVSNLVGCIEKPTQQPFTITYLDRYDIGYRAQGLREPSGLVLAQTGDGLWTVSDDEKKIFRLSLHGKLEEHASFAIPDQGLEGITLDPTGAFLFVVQEEHNEIIQLSLATQQVVTRQRLAAMQGYAAVAQAFATSDKNKGLEGITWNSDSNTIFVLKEGEPGLLLEISPDLRMIVAHKRLHLQNGFRHDEVSIDKLDFSGIFYDAQQRLFWIVSDKGQRVFLYDWNQDRVIHSAALAYTQGGNHDEIEKAEGIALDRANNRLYVVSDAEARLYVFALHDALPIRVN